MVLDRFRVLILVTFFYKALAVNSAGFASTTESQTELDAHNLGKIPPLDLHTSSPATRCPSS
eukprot:8176421-Pyramimonas_sp.AAC.1